MNTLENKNILFCITGSIAAYKTCEIIRNLRKEDANVQIAISKAGQKFIGVATLAALSNNKVITNLFPDSPKGGLEHIDLAFEIDLIIIAPATANIICKSGNGVADDLISTILCVCEQPQLFVPAMNHRMWHNKSTIEAVEKIRKKGAIVLNPDEGELASLHTGDGRFPELNRIMNEIRKAFNQKLYFDDMNILVTAGPTREPIDTVRFISNRSSGKMGFAIAKQIKNYGGNVDLVTGPVNINDIPQVNTIKIETALEMKDQINTLLKTKQYMYIFMVAAIADYKANNIENKKIKSSSKTLNMTFKKNPDILKQISKNSNAKIIGFALETNNGEKNALQKMKDKNLDYIILNYANEENAGFDSNTNHVFLFSKNGLKKEFQLDRKDRIAKLILNTIINNEQN